MLVMTLIAVSLAAHAACTEEVKEEEEPELTYYRDARRIIDTRCATCHREGDIAPFPLTTFDERSHV